MLLLVVTFTKITLINPSSIESNFNDCYYLISIIITFVSSKQAPTKRALYNGRPQLILKPTKSNSLAKKMISARDEWLLILLKVYGLVKGVR